MTIDASLHLVLEFIAGRSWAFRLEEPVRNICTKAVRGRLSRGKLPVVGSDWLNAGFAVSILVLNQGGVLSFQSFGICEVIPGARVFPVENLRELATVSSSLVKLCRIGTSGATWDLDLNRLAVPGLLGGVHLQAESVHNVRANLSGPGSNRVSVELISVRVRSLLDVSVQVHLEFSSLAFSVIFIADHASVMGVQLIGCIVFTSRGRGCNVGVDSGAEESDRERFEHFYFELNLKL